jgi:hypothetical protein
VTERGFEHVPVAEIARVARRRWPRCSPPSSHAVEPWVAANALIGVHRALIGLTRRLIVEETPQEQVAGAVRAEADRAFGRLEQGSARTPAGDLELDVEFPAAETS